MSKGDWNKTQEYPVDLRVHRTPAGAVVASDDELVPVMAKKDAVTGGIGTLAVLTQAQYDALAVKDEFTEYNIVAA